MASIIKVDEIQNSAGTPLLVNGYPRQPGQVIETLAGVCDGSSVTVASGTYTLQNVTAQQAFSTTYLDITGSTIAYTPPPGTTCVVYRFTFMFYWQNTQHSIQHFKFFIDGVEVIYARHNRSADYFESRYTFEWPIAIGGVANPNTGRQATWGSAKTLKMMSRRYAAGSNGGDMHGTVYWDGVGSNQFSIPSISVIAIA
jgi:hypothetical protein